MKDLFEIVKYLEDSGLLLKGDRKTIQNVTWYVNMLLGTLGASFLGGILAGEGDKFEESRTRNK